RLALKVCLGSLMVGLLAESSVAQPRGFAFCDGRWYSRTFRRWAVKAGIHPDYIDTTITCACGEVIRTRSTRPEIRVEVCSKCHPFYTGKQKLMATAGRVERFQRKYKRQTPSEG